MIKYFYFLFFLSIFFSILTQGSPTIVGSWINEDSTIPQVYLVYLLGADYDRLSLKTDHKERKKVILTTITQSEEGVRQTEDIIKTFPLKFESESGSFGRFYQLIDTHPPGSNKKTGKKWFLGKAIQKHGTYFKPNDETHEGHIWKIMDDQLPDEYKNPEWALKPHSNINLSVIDGSEVEIEKITHLSDSTMRYISCIKNEIKFDETDVKKMSRRKTVAQEQIDKLPTLPPDFKNIFLYSPDLKGPNGIDLVPQNETFISAKDMKLPNTFANFGLNESGPHDLRNKLFDIVEQGVNHYNEVRTSDSP